MKKLKLSVVALISSALVVLSGVVPVGVAVAADSFAPYLVDGVIVDVPRSHFESYADVEKYIASNTMGDWAEARLGNDGKIISVVQLRDAGDTVTEVRNYCDARPDTPFNACWKTKMPSVEPDHGFTEGPIIYVGYSWRYRGDFIAYNMPCQILYHLADNPGVKHKLSVGAQRSVIPQGSTEIVGEGVSVGEGDVF